MGFFDRFKRSERVYALVIEDGGTFVHLEQYEKDNEIIWDKYYGNAYVCPANVKPIRIKVGRKTQYAYLLWKDAGVAISIVNEIKEGKNFVREVMTDPDEAYAIMDAKSLQQVVAKNPAGYKLWFFFIIGLVFGTFVLGAFL